MKADHWFLLSSASVLLPVGLGMLRYARLGRSVRVILFMVCVTALFDGYSIYLSYESNNNLWVGHIHTVVQFGLISWYYFETFRMTAIRTAVAINALAFAGLAVISVLYLQGLEKFNSYTSTLESVLILVYVGTFFHQIFRNPGLNHSIGYSGFWINSAVGWYFATNLFLFALTNYVIENPNLHLSDVYLFHAFNYLAMNLLIAKAFLSVPKSTA